MADQNEKFRQNLKKKSQYHNSTGCVGFLKKEMTLSKFQDHTTGGRVLQRVSNAEKGIK